MLSFTFLKVKIRYKGIGKMLGRFKWVNKCSIKKCRQYWCYDKYCVVLLLPLAHISQCFSRELLGAFLAGPDD
jgi:hypothetical protein